MVVVESSRSSELALNFECPAFNMDTNTDSPLLRFLRNRGVPEDCLLRMLQEHVSALLRGKLVKLAFYEVTASKNVTYC